MTNTTQTTATKHSNSCSRVFARLDATCPRCQELARGASARKGWGRPAPLKFAPHVCSPKCGPVCTFGEW